MKRALLGLILFLLAAMPAQADRLLLKDGREITGKILYTNDQIIVIGNPMNEPPEQAFRVSDVSTVIHERYRLPPPDQRRKGFAFEGRLTGSTFSSSDLSLNAAPGIYIGGGFRLTPLFEVTGGLNWTPSIGSSNLVTVTDTKGTVLRTYDQFALYRSQITGRLYPFFKKESWPVEPYVFGGYSWDRLIPKSSGDNLKGAGWVMGLGALHRLTTHVYLDAQFLYSTYGFDRIQFNGQDGVISPELSETEYSYSFGVSYRI